MIQRKITEALSSPLRPGFLGEGHFAAAVFGNKNFSETDPFIVLMDDQVNLPGTEPAGGPHPHAGFETVTLVLDSESELFKEGSMELMTAGKGIIHTEEITAKTKVRIFQLWLILPPEQRWAEPLWQAIELKNVPKIKTAEKEIRVYSGSSNGLTSPVKNQTPLTLVEFRLLPDVEAKQQIPFSYNGFIYVVDGSVNVGGTEVTKEHSAWFDKKASSEETEITFTAGKNGARFVLYAGEPQHAPIYSHGPFIGNNQDDIRRLYLEFRQGKMQHVNNLPKERRIQY